MPDWVPIRRLGAGAFGEVWLVYDRAVGLERAVKYVHPTRVHDPTDLYREPRTLMALRHPHIVEVQDAGQLDDGRLYFLMEFVAAGSAEDKYKGGAAPLAESLRLVADACRGAEHAHTQGFIHRDIKPANILLGDAGAKVSDFGLATRADTTGIASPYGYVAHLAPEVVSEGETSILSDVYALGVTLYRLANGDDYLAAQGLTSPALEQAIVEGRFPDRKRFRPHIPEPVRRVVRAAMARDAGRRIKSASALRHAIERVTPKVSFLEVPSQAVAEWVGRSATHEWMVRVTRDSGRYEVLVKTIRHGGKRARRSSADCRSFQSRLEAVKHAALVMRRVTQHGG